MSLNMSRRSVLRAAGAGAAVLAAGPALAACDNGGGPVSVSNEGTKQAAWPAYVPAEVHYDLPALPANGAPAVLNYPSLPLPSSVKSKPGDGSTVSCMALSYGAAVKLDSSNRMVKAVGDAMGVTLKPRFVIDTGTSYTTALATMMAGGDQPDILMIPATGAPNISEFIRSKCADLSAYLSGDAIKEYPNLAALPTRGWQLMGRIGGGIYGVPTYRYNAPQVGLFADRGKLEKAGVWGKGVGVQEFTDAMAKLSVDGRYGIGCSSAAAFGWTYHAGAAGAPNWWGESGGSFRFTADTPEFEQAVENMHRFYTRRIYNPDALTLGAGDAQPKFLNGTWLTWPNGTGAAAQIFSQVRGFTPDLAFPYGDKPNTPGGDSVFGFTVIKKSSPARIKMLLRILDFFAAPFGTKEFELARYGVEGVHFTRDKDGAPANATRLGQTENSTNLPFQYFNMAPQPLFFPGLADLTKRLYTSQKSLLPICAPDASAAYRFSSATFSAKWAGVSPALNSAVMDAVSGKTKVSDWKGAVARIKQQNGIDQMAEEFAKAKAAAG
ncbi:hypothetical protein [Streptomyces murinus]|uniref:hypothetical protein n=1 Tax=Streptomyces murinus TaxID=33900 RepID=UPI002E0D596E|nr:hypothetical protein OG516_25850 [Streptomyces murinus]